MIEMSFFNILWFAFALIAFGSVFVFFARKLNTMTMGAALVLTGISAQFLDVDVFRSSHGGQIISAALWILFLIQAVIFKWTLQTKAKTNQVFFGLPFLAFVTMAVSLDLLTFLLGLSLFNATFLMMSALKGKDKKQLLTAIQKSYVAFLSFAYGAAILFSREGTLLLQPLHLKLSKGNWDNWTALGLGLTVLAVIIELYAIIPLVNRKK